ncbi:hypothetical protein CE143_02905 [Photorhabdus luminescens]|uniref:Knr4/Smi1-like domain-containing protein n=2 Tax=Photorhabdus TaxID=29487 RepID=A0A2S8Q9F0_9GAMM|nr:MULTISPECIES: SMI1/KNR4 family protein [Photorhabdus]PQQ29789.1 hypothetical protein C6H66_01415 [Photorhabdus hindustanensis]QXF32241.1 hypothetical protein B0X70_02920 [Photorhabdus akhurstii]UJD74033.1 hypothetical protein CE143_02905 [Photorhabdus luminescens]
MSIEFVKKAISLINENQDIADFEGIEDNSLIDLAEETLSLKFPDSYRFFLKNLGCGDIAGEEFYGIINGNFNVLSVPNAIWLTLSERKESNLPDNYVVIYSTGDGDYMVLDCNKNKKGLNEVKLWSPGVEEEFTFIPCFNDFGDFFYETISNALD